MFMQMHIFDTSLLLMASCFNTTFRHAVRPSFVFENANFFWPKELWIYFSQLHLLFAKTNGDGKYMLKGSIY